MREVIHRHCQRSFTIHRCSVRTGDGQVIIYQSSIIVTNYSTKTTNVVLYTPITSPGMLYSSISKLFLNSSCARRSSWSISLNRAPQMELQELYWMFWQCQLRDKYLWKAQMKWIISGRYHWRGEHTDAMFQLLFKRRTVVDYSVWMKVLLPFSTLQIR